jgi:hypothetical protein
MRVAAWVLALLLVAYPAVSWLAVRATVHSAMVGAHNTDAKYYIDNYGSPAQVAAAFMLGLNVCACTVLAVLGKALPPGIRFPAAIVPVLAAPVLLVAWFEQRWSPVTSNWGGDPDAWDYVTGKWPTWYPPAARTWLALVALACLVLTVSGIGAAVRRIRSASGSPRR